MSAQKQYIIQIEGRLEESWSSMFDNMNVSVAAAANGATITTLSGSLIDETQLHSLLALIRDLGLHLLLVRRVDEENA